MLHLLEKEIRERTGNMLFYAGRKMMVSDEDWKIDSKRSAALTLELICSNNENMSCHSTKV